MRGCVVWVGYASTRGTRTPCGNRHRRCGPSHPRARSSQMAGRYRYRPACYAGRRPNTPLRERPHNTPRMRRTGGPAVRLGRDRSTGRCEGFQR